MEGNFSLFWGWGSTCGCSLLVPDATPFDQFLEANPEAFMSLGDTSERLLVDDLLNCTTPGQRNCFTEFGHFKRDPNVVALTNATAEGGAGATLTPSPGTRNPATDPDPLLGADIFFASNLSLKNPNFRSGRCGACHNLPTLTDHTMPFTFKAQLPDFASEFSPNNPGVELLVEPLGRCGPSRVPARVRDLRERTGRGRAAVHQPEHRPQPGRRARVPGRRLQATAVYRRGTGVHRQRHLQHRCPADPERRRARRARSVRVAAFDLRAADEEPGRARVRARHRNGDLQPEPGTRGWVVRGVGAGSADQPRLTDEPLNPLLPPYLAPFVNGITVGDAQPDLDEVNAGINTLTDVAMLEGFLDAIGPFNPAAIKNEASTCRRASSKGRGRRPTACFATAPSRRPSCATSSSPGRISTTAAS
jgi:hypothetical protein